MMCCPLEAYDDGPGPGFSRVELRRAAKPWRCYECNVEIAIGQRYEYVVGKWDGLVSWVRTCLVCVEIRDHFACDGFTYGALWRDLEENFFPDMRAGGPCMNGLSPAAKDMLFTRCLEWREGQGARHERFG